MGPATKNKPEEPNAMGGAGPVAKKKPEEPRIFGVHEQISPGRIAVVLQTEFPELERRMGTTRFFEMCDTFSLMSGRHQNVDIGFFADVIRDHIVGIERFCDRIGAEYTRSNPQDVAAFATTATVAAVLFGVRPALLLSIGKGESIGFTAIYPNKNSNGTVDYGYGINFSRGPGKIESGVAKTFKGEERKWVDRVNRKTPADHKFLDFPAEIFTPERVSLPSEGAYALAISFAIKFSQADDEKDAARKYNGVGSKARKYAENRMAECEKIQALFDMDLNTVPKPIVKK